MVVGAEVLPQKPRGRPAIGKGIMTNIRWRPADLAMLDAWIADQPEPRPTRPQAIRRIVLGVIGLTGRVPKKDEGR